MTEPDISPMGGFKAYALKLIDTAYSASVITILAYMTGMILLAFVAAAVYLKLVNVPEFHP